MRQQKSLSPNMMNRNPATIVVILVAAVIYKWMISPPQLLPVEPGDAILLTGSSTGIGKHAALSLVKEGFTVFAGVRKESDGQALIESAEKFNLDTSLLKPIILDVTNSDHIKDAVETVSSFVGDRGLKGLFNNAGVGLEVSRFEEPPNSTSVEFTDVSVFRKTFDVNYFGMVEVTKSFLPLLRKGKGRILMNASMLGFLAPQFVSPYTSSKHAIEGFSDSLRRELLPLGVKVSILEPGLIATPIFLIHVSKGMEPYREAERAYIKSMLKDTMQASSPKVTSKAVIDAMRSKNPQTRYRIGQQAGFARFLSYLPAHWVDNLLVYGPKPDLTEKDISDLRKKLNTEFEL